MNLTLEYIIKTIDFMNMLGIDSVFIKVSRYYNVDCVNIVKTKFLEKSFFEIKLLDMSPCYNGLTPNTIRSCELKKYEEFSKESTFINFVSNLETTSEFIEIG